MFSLCREDAARSALRDGGRPRSRNSAPGTRSTVAELNHRNSRIVGIGAWASAYLAERRRAAPFRDQNPARRLDCRPPARALSPRQRMLAQLIIPRRAPVLRPIRSKDGPPWFVMEYVEGVPITEYWPASRGKLPRERPASFFEVYASGVVPHQHALIHLDLSPPTSGKAGRQPTPAGFRDRQAAG